MIYKKANTILPEELMIAIQEYIDGEYIYIPRKTQSKKYWGENTNIRNEFAERNLQIYKEYLKGYDTKTLANKFCLSQKSIQRIVLKEKNKSV